MIYDRGFGYLIGCMAKRETARVKLKRAFAAALIPALFTFRHFRCPSSNVCASLCHCPYNIHTMATTMQSQREASTAHVSAEHNASQRTVLIQSPTITPPKNPKDIALKITQAQKQALIDNLQLEGWYFD